MVTLSEMCPKIYYFAIFFVTSSVWAAPADPAVMKNPLEGSGQSSVALVPNGNNDAPGQQTIPAVLSNIPMAGTYLFPASDHHSLPTNPVDTLVVGPSGIIATGRALDSLAKSGGNLTPFLPGQTALTRGNDDQKSVQA
ncbi:uncharacterized protein LOC132708124 [Cylas formicarius]|uniref:uncharacterized protein LOC132708124 n=1 Tax=Cylas formicarius TaxID=197179 RepID=UPI002958D7D7|nr:uncharacterized protein LOC132708124 [Cylas formicarius]